MLGIFLVGAGSFVGGVCRYLLSTWVYKFLDNPWFPFGTLVINALGCLVIGFLARVAETRSIFTADAHLFIFIGILGGFTTFSAFALETLLLARDSETFAAIFNIGSQMVLGLLAVWIGNLLARI